MPVEHLRKRFADDLKLYPHLHEGVRDQKKAPPSVISISSNSSVASVGSAPPRTERESTSIASSSPPSSGQTSVSSSSSTPSSVASPTKSKARPIIISSDEGSDGSDAETERQLTGGYATDPKKRIEFPEPEIRPEPQREVYRAAPTAIHAPSNKHFIPPSRPPMEAHNVHVLPDNGGIPGMSEPVMNMTAREADQAVKDLISGSIVEDIEAEINPEDMIVPALAEDIKLLPHQALGRVWMRDREAGKKTGGILADDMGLGKTIQTLTRIVEGRARKADAAEGWSASTLVVCPLALVGQWVDEIRRMAPGFSVMTHHGSNRTANASAFRSHVVVTTYDVVKSEYEAYQAAAKNESQSRQSSLDSDEDSGSGGYRTLVQTKSKDKPKPRGRNSKKAALFNVKWWRVVLDEAHNIKNVKTKGAIASCELQAKYRWCLTGTPMQNNVQELYSLFKFLRIKPLNDSQSFDVQIGKPLKTGRNAGQAMKKLRAVLTQVMLRRTKDQTLNGERLIDLPARTVNIVSCDFDPAEKAFYDALEKKMGTVLEKLMSSSKGGNSYISVLLLLLRLRQACNHPELVTKDFKQDSEAVNPKSVRKGTSDQDGDADDLIAAFDQLDVNRKCKFCTTELLPSNTAEGEWSNHCIDCVPIAMQAKEEKQSSAKIRKIIEILTDIKERSEGREKTIVFSQFTSMLDLMEPFLRDERIRYVRYDGSMKVPDREAALAKIKDDPKTKVILISFKAGSTGLNLTACNNVILVDLWWNPALEEQAFDRAHRFGQTRDVNIFKLKIDNTVEDRILELQEKKRMLTKAALAGTKLKDMHLGFDELLALLKWGKEEEEEDSDD